MDRDREPDPDLAAELRQSAGREWAEEAAEDERLTELQRRRRQTLAEVMKEMTQRGERVSAEFGGHSFSGTLVGGGDDYVTVKGPGQTADIRLATASWSALPTDEPAEGSPGRELSFRALLDEYAAAEAGIRLALPAGGFVMGQVMVVASDHLEFTDVDHRRLLIPLESVLAVIRGTDDH